MSEAANSLEVIRSEQAAKGFAKQDGNNLQLADKIQFSSILKVLVNPPEKELEAAQKQIDPVEQKLQRQAEYKRELGNARANNDEPARPADDSVKKQQAAKELHTSSRPDDQVRAKDDGSADAPPPEKPKVKVDEEDVKESVALFSDDAKDPAPVKTDTTAAAAAASNLQQTAKPIELPVAKQAPVRILSQPVAEPAHPASDAPQLNRAAQQALAGANADANKADFADDLHNAVNANRRQDAPPPTPHASSTALAAKQASDLANRLDVGKQLQVQVEVGEQVEKPRAQPRQSLTPGAELAQTVKSATGERPAFVAKPDSNGTLAGDGHNRGVDPQVAAGRQLPQGTNTDQQMFAQMMRAQAPASAAAQQAQTAAASTAPKAPITPSDAIQTNAVAGPSGPSQVSQTAKANPTTAARQPQQAQKPAEQVAVQIKKAVGDGVDKINIKLHPKHLGRVEVRLELSRDGHIQATITAEKHDTLELLQRDSRGLERALHDVGLRTSPDSLNFSLRGDGQPRAETDRGHGRNRSPHPSERPDTPEVDLDQGILANKNVYGRNASHDGGVNIVI